MTTTELRNRIAESENSDWFKNKKEIFNFHYINYSLELVGVSSIYEFVNKQLDKWNNSKKPLPNEFQNSIKYFNNIKTHIIVFINTNISQNNINNIESQWQAVRSQINSTNLYPFTFDLPQTEFLLKLHSDFPNSFASAFAFITGRMESSSHSNRDYFIGSLLAYEFTLKDNSEILNRRNSEKASMSKLRNDFETYLNDSENVLIEELTKTKGLVIDVINEVDEFKKSKEILFTEWFAASKNEFQTFNTSVINKIQELEKTYNEKLKLEEPAKFWSDRGKKLKKQGWISLGILIIVLILVTITLGEILWNTPEQIYNSFFNGDRSAAIRWSIVYITLISFLAFGVRAINKVMFSSFHLARDAEERHTLTYFYLSLLKDAKVDEKDRQLIIQSLFSRADTGLLKEDSSPTMPNDMVGKFFGNK